MKFRDYQIITGGEFKPGDIRKLTTKFSGTYSAKLITRKKSWDDEVWTCEIIKRLSGREYKPGQILNFLEYKFK